MDTQNRLVTEDEIRRIVQDVSGRLEEKGARQLERLEVRELTTVADCFVVCTGTSTTHIRALSQEVEAMMEEKYGLRPHHIEGYDSAQWVLLDYVFLVVHIFRADVREFYSLERLWR